MKKNKLDSYTYAQLMQEIVGLCRKHKLKCEIIGTEKFEKVNQSYPIYKISVNPKAKLKFCVIAGVHGDEIAGHFTIVELLKNPKKYLSPDINYSIFPVVNPTGFDLRKRFDDDSRDLNCLDKRTLKSKNYKEIRAFYNSLKKESFDVFISFHEDLDQTKFYSYVFEKSKEPLYREIINSVKKTTPIWKTDKIYGNQSDQHGLIINEHDRSLEDSLYCRNMAKASLATETPGKLPLSKRIKINLANIRVINKYLLNGKKR